MRLLFGYLFLLCLSVVSVYAQETSPPDVIAFIRVEGAQRVEAETVRAYMVIRKGARYDVTLVDQSVKSLFASGLFADISIRRQNRGLIVSVIENPIINRISFEGNSKLRDDKLSEESQLRPRQIYTRAKVQDDVERFIELYRQSGRFAAVIKPNVVQLPENRVDLIYEITEGPKTGIRSINFQGNVAFSDYRLRQEIVTRETRWFRALSSNDNYDPDRMAYDRELLRRFYLSQGYADFAVTSSAAELSRDGTTFYVTFKIEEGELYQFDEARIETTFDSISPSVLDAAIQHVVGQRYDAREIDATVEELTRIVGQLGFAFATVRPAPVPDRARKIVRVRYIITEGARAYIERININGNSRTQDSIIRQVLRLSEGDAFNRTLLARSERNVRALDFFEDVTIEEFPGSREDQVIINVNVDEKSTGELSFGLGYSSLSKLSADLSISERNLLGRGQQLATTLRIGRYVDSLNVIFTEPNVLGRNLSAGVRVFSTVYDYSDISGVTSRSTGLSGNMGFPLEEDALMGLSLSVSEESYRNRRGGVILGSSYRRSKVEFGYFFTFDHRDDVIEPKSGWRFQFAQSVAIPLADVTYLRTTGTIDVYKELAEDWILHFRGNAGHIFDYEDPDAQYNIGSQVDRGVDHRIDNFYRTGSVPIRGFDRNGVGPRYVERDNNGRIIANFALGAKSYILGTLEVELPLGIPKDIGIKSSLFLDFGVLGGTDVRNNYQFSCGTERLIVLDIGDCVPPTSLRYTYIEDDLDWRASIGISFSWRSPIGPLRFDLAHAFIKEDYDRPKSFRFTVGTSF